MTHPLALVAPALSCPVCTEGLTVVASTDGGRPTLLGCADRHRFDVARQGQVTLLAGGGSGGLTADTTDMVAARTRVLDDDGPFAQLRTAIADAAGARTPAAGLLLDVGSGTGQYPASILDRTDGAHAVGLDLSKVCGRATARAHPRLAAVVADAWSRLPVADTAVDLITSIFAPRNVAEFARVLRPSGSLLVATPEPTHLAELIEPMGMLRVGDDKFGALLTSVADSFDVVSSEVVTYAAPVAVAQVVDLVAMGPSAFHHSHDDIVARATAFATEPTTVTVAVRMSLFSRR